MEESPTHTPGLWVTSVFHVHSIFPPFVFLPRPPTPVTRNMNREKDNWEEVRWQQYLSRLEGTEFNTHRDFFFPTYWGRRPTEQMVKSL